MNSDFTNARYESPKYAYMSVQRDKFDKIIGSLATYLRISKNEFRIDHNVIEDIIARLHQRINYYLFFHGKHLTQSRQAGIKAFWILRYHPLISSTWKKEYDINVYFAFYLLFAEIIGEHLSSQPKEIQCEITNKVLIEYQESFLRALSEYDISKESMMLISECVEKIVLLEIDIRTK